MWLLKSLNNFIFTISATKFVYAQSIEVSIYGGLQSSPHSRITGKHSTSGAQYSELVGWEGKSFDAPIYYGIRTTFWRSDKLSYGAEFTHTKAYAPNKALQSAGFDRLEFTDGHNIITLNINKRWELGEFNTYSLVGLGIAIPHVDALPSKVHVETKKEDRGVSDDDGGQETKRTKYAIGAAGGAVGGGVVAAVVGL